MKITVKYLLELVEKHGQHLSLKQMVPLYKTEVGDCTNVQDCLIMYLLILENNPRFVIEFSPMLGYSTRYLASAMRILGKPGKMFTVEHAHSYHKICTERIRKMGLLPYCDVLKGEAISLAAEQIKQRKAAVDFVFIDSNHSKQFAQQYIEKLFPLFIYGCTTVVHDICGKDVNTEPHSIDFITSLNSDADQFAEYKVVKEFLIKHNIKHTLTHPLLGGWWTDCSWRKVLPNERSPKLPDNKKFYEGFELITGYDLKQYTNFQHPNALIFRLEKNG